MNLKPGASKVSIDDPRLEMKHVRHVTTVAFHCDRCLQNKMSKNTYEFKLPGGRVLVICNGCHGALMATREDPEE